MQHFLNQYYPDSNQKKMKKILVFVSSLDGKTTRWDNPFVRTWSSKDDQVYFSKLWKESELIVLGSNTYNADPIKPIPAHLVVVMTRNVSPYQQAEIPGQLEFTSETPETLVRRFEKLGHSQMLVVGGAQVATSFFKDELIDEVWLTIEPRIFGQGNSFVANEKLDVHLSLLSCEKLNDEGTLLTKYAVLKAV